MSGTPTNIGVPSWLSGREVARLKRWRRQQEKKNQREMRSVRRKCKDAGISQADHDQIVNRLTEEPTHSHWKYVSALITVSESDGSVLSSRYYVNEWQRRR